VQARSQRDLAELEVQKAELRRANVARLEGAKIKPCCRSHPRCQCTLPLTAPTAAPSSDLVLALADLAEAKRLLALAVDAERKVQFRYSHIPKILQLR